MLQLTHTHEQCARKGTFAACILVIGATFSKHPTLNMTIMLVMLVVTTRGCFSVYMKSARLMHRLFVCVCVSSGNYLYNSVMYKSCSEQVYRQWCLCTYATTRWQFVTQLELSLAHCPSTCLSACQSIHPIRLWLAIDEFL